MDCLTRCGHKMGRLVRKQAVSAEQTEAPKSAAARLGREQERRRRQMWRRGWRVALQRMESGRASIARQVSHASLVSVLLPLPASS